MNDRTALEWLNDARSYALEARDIASGLDRAAFEGDRRGQLAIHHCLALVGESLNQVRQDVRALAPDIPWAGINGLRNRLVHGFFLIDLGITLRINQQDTEPLVVLIDQLIAKIEP